MTNDSYIDQSEIKKVLNLIFECPVKVVFKFLKIKSNQKYCSKVQVLILLARIRNLNGF